MSSNLPVNTLLNGMVKIIIARLLLVEYLSIESFLRIQCLNKNVTIKKI